MSWQPSYATRREVQKIWTYDSLTEKVLSSKSSTVNFLLDLNVLKRDQPCPKCSKQMTLTSCSSKDFREEACFRCQKTHFDAAKQSK